MIKLNVEIGESRIDFIHAQNLFKDCQITFNVSMKGHVKEERFRFARNLNCGLIEFYADTIFDKST